MKRKIVIGCFESRLEKNQASVVAKILSDTYPKLKVEVKPFLVKDMLNKGETSSSSKREICTNYLQEKLLQEKIDVIVYSMKNYYGSIDEKLKIVSYPYIDDDRDVLVSKRGLTIDELGKNPKIGTSSLRRINSLKKIRKDVQCVPIKGNILTRIEKLEKYEYDAVVLTALDMKSMGLESKISNYFDQKKIYPAPLQGVLGVQCRIDDESIVNILENINNDEAEKVGRIESDFCEQFDRNEYKKIGCYTEIKEDKIIFKIAYYSEDGEIHKVNVTKNKEEYSEIGEAAFILLNKKI